MSPEIQKKSEQKNDSRTELKEHLQISLEDNKITEQERQKLEQLAAKARDMAVQSEGATDALQLAVKDVAQEQFVSERKLLSLIWGNEIVEKAFVDDLKGPFAGFEKLQEAGVPSIVLHIACENFLKEHAKFNTYRLKEAFENYRQFQNEDFAEALLMKVVESAPYEGGKFIQTLNDEVLAQKLMRKLVDTSPEYAVQFLERIDEKDRESMLLRALSENPQLVFDNGLLLEKNGYGELLRRATIALADQSSYTLFKKFDEWKDREFPEGKNYLGDALVVLYKTNTSAFFQEIGTFENEPGVEKSIYEAALFAADQLPEIAFKNLKKIQNRKNPEGQTYVNKVVMRAAKTAAEIQQNVFFENCEIIEKTVGPQAFESLLYTAATRGADGDPEVALRESNRFRDGTYNGQKYAVDVVKRASEMTMVTSPEVVVRNFQIITVTIGEEAALSLIEEIALQKPEAVLQYFARLENAQDKARVRRIFEALVQRSPRAAFAAAKDVIRRPSKELEKLIERSPQYVDDAYQGIVGKAPGSALLAYTDDALHAYPDGLLQKAIKLSAQEDPFALLVFMQKSESKNIEVPEDSVRTAITKAMEVDGLRLYQFYTQEKKLLSKFVSENDMQAACVESAKKQPIRVFEDANMDLSIFDAKTLYEVTEAALKENPFIHLSYRKEIMKLSTYSDLQELQETLQVYVKRVQESMDNQKRQKVIQAIIAHVLEDEDRLSAYSDGIDIFNKKTGLSLECKGVRGEPLQFVFINTFHNGENTLPVCLTVTYSEMKAVQSKDDILKILDARYVEEKEKYKEQRNAWSNVYSRIESGTTSFEPDFRTAVLIEEVHGGELERDMPAMLDLYEKKGAKPFAVCTNNMSQWELQVNAKRKQQGKSVLEIRSGTERTKLETWKEFLQKAVEDPAIDKVLIHYKAHGLESGVTVAEGSKVSGAELAEALMSPFQSSDPNDPRNGKPLSSLIPVMIIPMTCHPGRQIDLMKKRFREMKSAKDISFFASGNYEVTQGGDPDYNFNKYSIVSESTRDMRGKRAVFSYYLLQYFEMLEGVKNPEPPLGTMIHALHYASRMSEQDSSFRQKPIGHRISEEHFLDERVSKMEQEKLSSEKQV